MTLVPITYKGGIYQHDIVIDLIEDLGGYIIQKHVIAAEVVLQCFVPRDDIELIRTDRKTAFWRSNRHSPRRHRDCNCQYEP